MRKHVPSLAFLSVILTTAGAAAVAHATVYGFTGSRYHDPGRKFVLAIDSGTSAPCVDTVANVDGSGSGSSGASIGIAKNLEFGSGGNYIWASVTSGASETGCGAASGSTKCLGAARLAVTSTTPTRYWVSGRKTDPKSVDVIGSATSAFPSVVRWMVADKTAGSQAWRLRGSLFSDSDLSAVHPSQVERVSSTLAIGTDAGRATCADSTITTDRVRLLEWTSSGVVERDYEEEGGYFKPEGVYVRDISPETGCSYDSVAYVTDYCGFGGTNGRLFVYGIDETNKTLTQTDVQTLPEGCKPSTVSWESTTGNLFVLCQTADTIIPVTLNNPCDLNAQSTAVDLMYTEGGGEPACGVSASQTSCNGASPRQCAAHDISWITSPSQYSGWLFVTLTEVNQVTVVKASDPAIQHPFYGSDSPALGDAFEFYNPNDLEIVEVP